MNCKNCNNPLDDGMKFCKQCGAKVEPYEAYTLCSCGEQLDKDAMFCTNCGAKNNGAVTIARSCSRCGETLEDGTSFCTNCGASVTGNVAPTQQHLTQEDFDRRLLEKCLAKSSVYKLKPVTSASVQEYIGLHRKFDKKIHIINASLVILSLLNGNSKNIFSFEFLTVIAFIYFLFFTIQLIFYTIRLSMRKITPTEKIDIEDLSRFLVEYLAKHKLAVTELEDRTITVVFARGLLSYDTIGYIRFPSDFSHCWISFHFYNRQFNIYKKFAFIHSILSSAVEIYIENKKNV